MFPAGGLLPGHVLVHHDKQFFDGPMGWGEWDGSPQEDLSATHIDLALSQSNLAKMNPPASCVYPVSQVDPKTIIVLALKPILVPGRGMVDPHTDLVFAAALEAEVQANLGEPYDWQQIAEFTGIGLEARLDPAAARAAIAQARPLDVQHGHFGVCSVWTQARLEGAIARAYKLTMDLTMGSKVGHLNGRPSDWQTFPDFHIVSQIG